MGSAGDVLILIFATQRIANIWFHERAGEGLRLWTMRRGGLIGYLGGCQLCLSVWIGLLSAAVWTLGGTVGRIIVLGFAASAGALFLNQVWTWFQQPRWPMPPLEVNGRDEARTRQEA